MGISIVEIKWVDSAFIGEGWQYLADAEEGAAVDCTTVGIFVREDDECVVVASSMAGDGDDCQVSGVIAIPREAILEYQEITIHD